jgi:hypothetical protein
LGGKEEKQDGVEEEGNQTTFFRNNTQGKPIPKDPRMTKIVGKRPRQ